MQKLTMALLLLVAVAGCGEDPEPPRRVKAPEPPKPVIKTPEPVQTPKPPPPEDKKPAAEAGPVAKVLLDPSLPEWLGQAPAEFKVKFTTSKGDFVIQVTREWSPRGADRFYGLVKNGFYDGIVFFRVVSGF